MLIFFHVFDAGGWVGCTVLDCLVILVLVLFYFNFVLVGNEMNGPPITNHRISWTKRVKGKRGKKGKSFSWITCSEVLDFKIMAFRRLGK